MVLKKKKKKMMMILIQIKNVFDSNLHLTVFLIHLVLSDILF